MGFGINKNFFSFLLNPYLFYVDFKRKKLLKKYSNKYLKIGLYVSIKNSKIGNYVYLGSKTRLNNSEIGDHSYTNSDTHIGHTKIGKFCSIGSNVQFGMSKHPTDLISTHPAFYSNNKAFKTFSNKNHFKEYEEIILGNDVWVGSNVTIIGGVTIGDGAIVAAGAIVTKNVKPYEIVGGVPAKHIKFRIGETLIDKLIETKWWDKDEKWLEQNHELFLNKNNFLKSLKKND